jgi:serine/threonine protein kinase
MSDKDFGRYQLENEIGRGGMSVVYRASDPRLQRSVAVKVMHPHLAVREDARRRLLQEATAIARLEHPNVLKVYDYDYLKEGSAYIVSELIEGLTLKEWVHEHPIRYCEVAALLALPIFDALSHAHEQGIIHRDIKPENIMIRYEGGAPVLMDFGIAHLVDAETLTATGAVLGSPAHMAPEVVNGDPLSESVDLYSMGTVLYWMMCDALPFVAPNPAALFKRILEGRYDPIHERRPDTLGALSRLAEECIQCKPELRPIDAGEVRDRLQALLAEVGLHRVQDELASFAAHPSQYQDELHDRLLNKYLDIAHAQIEAGDLATAHDRVKRALALAPENKDALRLHQQILRAQPKWSLSKMRVASLLVGALIVSLSWPIMSASTPQGSGVQNGDRVRSSAITVTPISASPRSTSTPPIVATRERPSTPSPALSSLRSADDRPKIPMIESKREGEGSGQIKASAPTITLEASKEKRSVKSALSLYSKKRAIKRKLKRRNLTKKAVLPSALIKSSAKKLNHERALSPPKTQRVYIGSRYKGTTVLIDGEEVGKVYQIERKDGIELKVGAQYKVRFSSPYCEDYIETLDLTSSTKRPPKVTFQCQFKPSILSVNGPKGAEVFLRGRTMIRLGLTNQDIRYKMTSSKKTLSLLIVSPNAKDTLLKVALTAGHRREVSVEL